MSATQVLSGAGELARLAQLTWHSREPDRRLRIRAIGGSARGMASCADKLWHSLAPCQTRPMDPVVLGPGAGETVALGGSRVRLIAQGGDAGGRVSITDFVLAPGFPGPRPHVHREMTDMFFVLEGLTVRLGDEEHEAGPGSFILAPPGVAHTFANRSERRPGC